MHKYAIILLTISKNTCGINHLTGTGSQEFVHG